MTTSAGPVVPFGRPMREAHFGFSPSYLPLNHGSYGTAPVSVRNVRTAIQTEAETTPDRFILLDWPSRLKESRSLAANMLHCATEDLVFVANATTGMETIFKNQVWQEGDVILVYELVYIAVRANLTWLAETAPVRIEVVPVAFPVTDDALVDTMVAAAQRINATGTERVKLAIVDAIVSMPGIRVPFERLVPALQAEGALVVVDAAHGIGHIDIDIGKLDPDFLVTNPHKWLFVPRSAAAMYVARRHHHMMRATVPTSARLRPVGFNGEDPDALGNLFDFIATTDNTNYLTVKAAIDFRTQICGGEKAIQTYSQTVARESAAVVVEILGTEIMDIPGSCMRDCNFANVRLPLKVVPGSEFSEDGIPEAHGDKVSNWLKSQGVKEVGCFYQTCLYRGVFWWRLSGVVYVDVEDFRKGAEALKGLCERVMKGEYLQ